MQPNVSPPSSSAAPRRWLLVCLVASWLAACGDTESQDGSTDAGGPDTDGAIPDGENGPPDVGVDGSPLDAGLADALDGSYLDGLIVDSDNPSPDAGEGGLDASVDGPTDAASDGSDAGGDGGLGDAGQDDRPTCYYGDFDTEGVHQVACLWSPGPVRTLLDAPTLAGAEIGTVAVSPDGGEVALTLRESIGAPMKLLVVSLDDPNSPRVVLVSPSADREISNVAYAADGNWLGFVADFALAGTRSLYVIPVAGGFVRRVSPEAEAGKDVTGFAWAGMTPGPSWLAYTGDVSAEGVHGLWSVDVAHPSPQPQAIVTQAQLGTDRDVQRDVAWDGQGRIVFRSNHGDGGTVSLYQAEHDGSEVQKIPGTSLVHGQGSATIGSFGLSPDGASVAFSANSPDARVYEVFVVGLTPGSSAAVRVSDVAALSEPGMLSGPAFHSPLAWSADGAWLSVVADWRLSNDDRDDAFCAFVLPSTGPAGGWRVLGAPQGLNLNVRDVRFDAPDGSLIVRGDLVENGAFELYVVNDPADPDQDPLDVRFEEVPPQGDVAGLAVGP